MNKIITYENKTILFGSEYLIKGEILEGELYYYLYVGDKRMCLIKNPSKSITSYIRTYQHYITGDFNC